MKKEVYTDRCKDNNICFENCKLFVKVTSEYTDKFGEKVSCVKCKNGICCLDYAENPNY